MMIKPNTIIDVGVQDPELKNAPITGEMAENFDVINKGSDGPSMSFFNNTFYTHDINLAMIFVGLIARHKDVPPLAKASASP